MTLNIYASADPESKRAAAETIDEVMGKRPEPRPCTPPNPDDDKVIAFSGKGLIRNTGRA
jgi:hypothetical protein